MAMIANELDKKGLAKEADHITRNMLKLSQVNYFANAGIDPNSYTGTAQQNEALRKAIDPSAPDFATAYTKKFGPLSTPQDRISKLTGGASPAIIPGAGQGMPPQTPNASSGIPPGATQTNRSQGAAGSPIVLEPIPKINSQASSKIKKEIFAQAQTNKAMNLNTLLDVAGKIQQTSLAQPIADYNSKYSVSFSEQGNPKALGELAQEYLNLSNAIQNTYTNIKELFNNNLSVLNQLQPGVKIQTINNIFVPITNIISAMRKGREKIDPNLSGLFAYNAGINLNKADETLNSVLKNIQSLINGTVF